MAVAQDLAELASIELRRYGGELLAHTVMPTSVPSNPEHGNADRHEASSQILPI